jgi:hypothetical protein
LIKLQYVELDIKETFFVIVMEILPLIWQKNATGSLATHFNPSLRIFENIFHLIIRPGNEDQLQLVAGIPA